MKTLQSNFTTPEQSKRLLELGVPADSADCYWTEFPLYEGKFHGYEHKPQWLFDDESFSKLQSYCKTRILPCWSVGQLMRIRGICAIFPPHGSSFFAHNDRYYIKSLMHIIEKHPEWFDFSKLDEQK